MIDLSIILPVFNEEKNIPILVKKLKSLAKKNKIEVIFVEDGGSSDNTSGELKKAAKKNRFIKNIFIDEKGYGISVYSGLKKAKGEFISWSHADLQTDPQDCLKALNLIKKEKNIQKIFIKGKRYGRPLIDSFFTLGMSIFETLYLDKVLYDINAQPNLFHHSFLDNLKNPPKDFAFDLYVYYLARINNYKILRFPVFFGERIHGYSKWNFGFKSKLKFIKRTIDFSFDLKKLLKNANN